jgi:uncharacterized protein (TIGR02231 family)
MIERTAVLSLEPGEHTILFPGLPSTVDERSFRVKGHAPVPVTILGSDTRRILHKEAADERVRTLEEQIAGIEKEKSHIVARLEVIRTQREFIESVKSTTTEQLSKELGFGPIDAKGWKEAFDFVGVSLDELAVRRLALESQLSELDDDIMLLTQELEQVRRSGAKASYTVAADLDVGGTGGEIELVLTYLIRGASWVPAYDARFLPENEVVEMTAYGFVTQKTGEDWANVDLALSTAEPATGAAPPNLAARFLDLERHEKEKKLGGRAGLMEYEADEMGAAPAEHSIEAVALQAGLVSQVATLAQAGVTATYSVPSKEDVPADGNPAKTAIGQMSFTPQLKHAATPLRVEKVYLSSDIVNDSIHTLLPGLVDVFVGPDMVGRVRLDKPVVPGETFHMSFGTDSDVKVERKILKRETSKPGKGKTRILESMEISINNYKKTPVVVTLKDRVPVSRHKDIDVDIRKLEPEPDSVGPDGIVEWKLQVAPGEEVSVLLEYRITYPTEGWIRGL